MHSIEIECDECGMSFPEDCLVVDGSSTLCKWCHRKHIKKRAEDESRLAYEEIAKFIHRAREMFPDDEGEDEEE